MYVGTKLLKLLKQIIVRNAKEMQQIKRNAKIVMQYAYPSAPHLHHISELEIVLRPRNI